MTALILPKYLARNRDDVVSEATHSIPARVPRAQTYMREKGVNVYLCPVCRKEVRFDDAYEPACTGPNETTDDHPMTPMEFVRVDPPRKLILAK